jgi:UDP-2,3-diacylglucosamine pyrophosphatase LpxH
MQGPALTPLNVQLEFKTLVLSDIHLGTAECKALEVNYLLEHTKAARIILNGDIIDGWSLRRKGGWKPEHTRFVSLVLDRVESRESSIVYTRGNHDDMLGRFLPLSFGSMQIVEDAIIETAKGPYLVLHGDVFDSVTQNNPLLSHIGDIGYQTLLKFNRFYNLIRRWFGMDYFSLSKVIKRKVKEMVNIVSRFEDHLEALVLKRGCVGAIVGHLHIPADRMIGKIHYINSGDWVESLTCAVENLDGSWEILSYVEFCKRLQLKAVQS